MVQEIKSASEFTAIITKSIQDFKLVVVDFFTSWCPPCKLLAPEYEKLSKTYENEAVFLKVNCDDLPDLATQEDITKLPTVKGYVNKTNVFSLTGPSVEAIVKNVQNHAFLPVLKNFLITKPPRKTVNYLQKIVTNIIQKPESERYRQLKFTNESFNSNLWSVKGVEQILLDMGFDKEANRMYMKKPSSLETVEKYKILLDGVVPLFNESGENKSNNCSSSLFDEIIETPSPINDNRECLKSSKKDVQLTQSEKTFIDRIESTRQKIPLYENMDLLNIVKAIIDIDTYKSECLSQEKLLKRILRWFKYDFFSWFSPQSCKLCKKPYSAISSDKSTPEEAKWLAGTVEIYGCLDCPNQERERFPRYNHPEILLSTRTGRCGEWANCFALILRALIDESMFEAARFVMDWSDHVWCEVFVKLDSELEKRWVHVDPCEGVYNSPLMYKLGWGKLIDYIIGVTLKTGDVQDITWRYTNDYKATMTLRNQIRENVLIEKLLNYHQISSQENKGEIIKNIITELVRFLPGGASSSTPKLNEYKGRTTGSLEWRAARGELGMTGEVEIAEQEWERQYMGEVIRPTPYEIKNGCVHIQYNCSLDRYARPYDKIIQVSSDKESSSIRRGCNRGNRNNDVYIGNDDRTFNACSSNHQCDVSPNVSINKKDLLSHDTDGWQALATSWRNIKRKVEYDWHIVYLARIEGCSGDSDGQITWTIDVSNTNMVIGEISVFASSAEFHNASVKWWLHSPGASSAKDISVNGFVSTLEFCKQSSVCLSAKLSSPESVDDVNAWQHAQLCRQKSTDFDVKTLQIKVELLNDDDKVKISNIDDTNVL